MRFSSLFAAVVFAGIGWLVAAPPGDGALIPLLPGEPEKADLVRAREMLERWESDAPQKSARRMQVLYWTPADREPQPEYRARLTRVMKHIQEFYRSQMAAWGFPGRTIQLDLTDDGQLKLPVVKGTLKSADCSEQDQSDGQAIRRDCLRALRESGVDGERETIVIFCNLAEWDPDKRIMSHHSPYYASGDSTHGTAWQVDSPLLDSDLLGVKDQRLQDGQYGFITLGRYNSIFVGGVCHELGHALGLPHCRESEAARAARGTALMGSGNRTCGEELRGESKGSFLTLPHALKIVAHPQFSGSVKQIATAATATFSDWNLESTPNGLKVAATVKTNLPCHAVLAYGDPDGGGDYDSAIAAAVPQPDGKFSLLLPLAQTRTKPAVLSFVAVCVNGAATASVWSSQAFSLSCRIDDAGRYDVAPALATLEVKAHAAAARAGTLRQEISARLSPVSREALRRLAQPDTAKAKPSPAAADPAVKSLPLSDATPAKATTGFGGVHFDRDDKGDPLTGPNGPAAHGLWAHANSEFTYGLDGKWKTLTGECALLQSGSGPVQATILADGKEVWNSKTIAPATVKSFSVDVTGITTLQLHIKGTRGIGSAHSAWLEPVLGR